MAIQKDATIAEPKGKLGVLLVGLGAVSTTFIAGVEAIKKGIAEPVGSLTQMGTIRLGKRTENRVPLIKDFVPLAKLEDMVFGAGTFLKTQPTKPPCTLAYSRKISCNN